MALRQIGFQDEKKYVCWWSFVESPEFNFKLQLAIDFSWVEINLQPLESNDFKVIIKMKIK